MRKLLSIVLLSTLLTGCLDNLQTEEARKLFLKIATQTKQVDAELSNLQEQLKTSDVELAKKINEKIESKQKLRTQLVASADSLEASMKEANNGGDVLAGAVNAAVPFMGPYGPLVALGVSVIGGLFANGKRKQHKKQADENRRQAIAAHNNIDSIIADPSLSGGAGKFDANDPATMARLRDLDRAEGIQDLMKEANK